MGERHKAREVYERQVTELKRSGVPEARAIELGQRVAKVYEADLAREKSPRLPPPSWKEKK